MGTILPFPQKEKSIDMNFHITNGRWELEYSFVDDGRRQTCFYSSDSSSANFNSSLIEMVEIFHNEHCGNAPA